MKQFVIYRDLNMSNLGFDPFTDKFEADKQTALDFVKHLSLLFPRDRFALQEFGKSGWVWKGAYICANN